jgi:hypothetical protein
MLTALAGCDIDALVFVAEMYGVQPAPAMRVNRWPARWLRMPSFPA